MGNIGRTVKLHLAQMIEDANSAVTNIKVVQGSVLMKLMQSSSFSHEQKQELVEMLKPIDSAISEATAKFSYEIQE